MEYGGQYETPCSRISHLGAFSGCRIGPTGHPGVPPLRLRTFWLRLRTFWLRLPSSLLPSSLLRLPSSLPSLLKGTLGPPQRAAICFAQQLRLRTESASSGLILIKPLIAQLCLKLVLSAELTFTGSRAGGGDEGFAIRTGSFRGRRLYRKTC